MSRKYLKLKTKWLVENHVLTHKFKKGRGTQKELRQFVRNIEELTEDHNGPIHVLLDLNLMNRPVSKMDKLRDILTPLKNPSLKWFVIYGHDTPGVNRFLSNVFNNVIGIKTKMFETREEAYSFLANVDPDLSLTDFLDGEARIFEAAS